MEAEELGKVLIALGKKQVRCRIFHWVCEDGHSGFEDEVDAEQVKSISEESDGDEEFVVLEFE